MLASRPWLETFFLEFIISMHAHTEPVSWLYINQQCLGQFLHKEDLWASVWHMRVGPLMWMNIPGVVFLLKLVLSIWVWDARASPSSEDWKPVALIWKALAKNKRKKYKQFGLSREDPANKSISYHNDFSRLQSGDGPQHKVVLVDLGSAGCASFCGRSLCIMYLYRVCQYVLFPNGILNLAWLYAYVNACAYLYQHSNKITSISIPIRACTYIRSVICSSDNGITLGKLMRVGFSAIKTSRNTIVYVDCVWDYLRTNKDLSWVAWPFGIQVLPAEVPNMKAL